MHPAFYHRICAFFTQQMTTQDRESYPSLPTEPTTVTHENCFANSANSANKVLA